MTDWAQYPDSTLRETYPPMPSKGGNVNKEASDTVVGSVASPLQVTQQREAEFRARQRMRRLQTRGAEAMREPEESLQMSELPDDPALDEFKQAGWLG